MHLGQYRVMIEIGFGVGVEVFSSGVGLLGLSS